MSITKVKEIVPCPNENCDPEFGCCVCEYTGKVEIYHDKNKNEILFRDEISKDKRREYHELSR